MNTIKRFFVIFLILTLPAITLVGQKGKGAQTTGDAVYNFTRTKLENYYGRKDFSDAGRTTGWYRVDDFLKWIYVNKENLYEDLKKNSSCLLQTNKFPQDNNAQTFQIWLAGLSSESVSFLGHYLGARYLESKYPDHEKNRGTGFESCSRPRNSSSYDQTQDLISFSTQYSFTDAVVTGMHEMTHALPNRKDGVTYTELATFYTSVKYGLPLKKGEARIAKYEIPNGFREYFSYIVGPVIYKELNSTDIKEWGSSVDFDMDALTNNFPTAVHDFILSANDVLFEQGPTYPYSSGDSFNNLLSRFSNDKYAFLEEDVTIREYIKNGNVVYSKNRESEIHFLGTGAMELYRKDADSVIRNIIAKSNLASVADTKRLYNFLKELVSAYAKEPSLELPGYPDAIFAIDDVMTNNQDLILKILLDVRRKYESAMPPVPEGYGL